MKSGREHRVPLSRAAVSVLKEMQARHEDDLLFPADRRGKPLSNMAMLMMLRRMDRADLTTHGFRSTFRDWAADCTNFPREVAEAALAHVVGDKVEAAYRRGDLFEKRRRLTASTTSRTRSSWLLNVTMESTPRSASATAVAPPMPELAPVMIAILRMKSPDRTVAMKRPSACPSIRSIIWRP
jgi:hypothetical protein